MGALLVEMGFIGPDHLERALAEQQRSAKRLGKLLIEAGIITEDRLVHALSQQLGIEACDPIMTPVHEAVLALVPSEVAFRHRVLPVARQRVDGHDLLYIATADPLDKAAAEAIGRAVPPGTRVRWMLAGETEMDLALARHYGAAPGEGKKKPKTHETGETPVKVIPGRPVAPPRRPDGGPAGPLHSTGDIFAALQNAVDSSDLSASLDIVVDEEVEEAESVAPRPSRLVSTSGDLGEPVPGPPPSSDQPIPVKTSGDLQVVFPPAPSDSFGLPAREPDPSHPSMDLARLGGQLHDDVHEEILEAEEVIESGVYPPPDEAPPGDAEPHPFPAPDLPADLPLERLAPSGDVEPEGESGHPLLDEGPGAPPGFTDAAPADAEPHSGDDPVLPAPKATPTGPSWADMVGGDDGDPDESDDLFSVQAEAATLPAATDSLAGVPAPTEPPAVASPAPTAPAGPPPTELDLEAGALEAAPEGSARGGSGPTEPEPPVAEGSDATLLDLNAGPAFAPPPDGELGLDGLPLDAPSPVHTGELGLGDEEAAFAPAEDVEALPIEDLEELEPLAEDDEGGPTEELPPDASLPEDAAPEPISRDLAAPSPFEAPTLEVSRREEAAEPTYEVKARLLLERFVAGETLDPEARDYVLRLLASLVSRSLDDADLAAALERVGPPPT